ncbi:Protein yellow [Mizuhopecten yessoensis]|uniref:Protein yellow n=1 Tax=Mizuhopecten yessoensis TaxID=6573 RepID=A0A210PU39_MIZYE|nr:Protein yellow [Mizuhopecten yessoensis]
MSAERIKVFYACIFFTCLVFVHGNTNGDTQPTLVYKWVKLEFVWPNDTMKQQYIAEEDYIPENNAINGIKVYNKTVYLTIPRLKKGIPATLNVVINTGSDSPVLRPYPSWYMHRKHDCDALYLVQSMEIDPNTGYMWILDTGLVTVGPVDVAPIDRCPPKLVIYDINNDEEIHRYIFDKTKVGVGMFYLNDIVLDYGADGTARFAYISDTLGRKLVVYDRKLDKAYVFVHASMQPNPDYATVTISNSSTTVTPLGINGIAISSDFRYVYFSSVAGLSLYQVSTAVLRDSFATDDDFSRYVRKVGDKVTQGDGMFYGKGHNLYFSTLGRNAVYKWPILSDMDTQGKDSSNVEMMTQTIVSEDARMEWVDSLAIDEEGDLWFTSNNLHTFFGNSTEDGSWNFYVWRMFVDDSSYLNITGLTLIAPTQGSADLTSSVVCLLVGVASCFISAFM